MDANGDIVQPYGRYDAKRYAAPGEERRYHVEFWPIGNRFKAGHRLRLHLLGGSAFHLPTLPAINTVRAGGATARGCSSRCCPGATWPRRSTDQDDGGRGGPTMTSPSETAIATAWLRVRASSLR